MRDRRYPEVDPLADPIKEPSHYKIQIRSSVHNVDIDAWDISDALFLNDALLWNTLKYLFRVGCGGKSNDLQDLKKARQYLDREIARRESTPRLPESTSIKRVE
mgnify:FL=1|jgi:hypothetical protein|tara:strand:+ start:1074 stop:1385 length:312 start_codon:yes stop_codon:yes gene_type:complete